MKSYIIHFIRHGMTEANIKGQYAGIWDVPICDIGRKKLAELKKEYEYPMPQEFYSSPLSRCVETCSILYPNATPILVDGLKECNFGDWEGKTPDELSGDPKYLEWVKSGRKVIPPNGESWDDFGKRIALFFESTVDSLMKRGVTSAAMFTHGGVISVLLALYGLPRANPFEWMMNNGCGYSVRITPGLWMRDKVFEVYGRLPVGSKEEISGEFKKLIDNFK